MSEHNTTLGLEIVIQLCRLQVQRERGRIAMTPKLRGVRPMLDKLKEAMARDVDKLASRVDETNEMRVATFKASHALLDGAETDLKEVRDYLEDLSKSNGGDPLDGSEEQSSNVARLPRSSEVASR